MNENTTTQLPREQLAVMQAQTEAMQQRSALEAIDVALRVINQGTLVNDEAHGVAQDLLTATLKKLRGF